MVISLFLILFLPLLASATIGVATRRRPKLSGLIAVGTVFLSLLLALRLTLAHWPLENSFQWEWSLAWLSVGGLAFEFGFLLNPLTLLMLLVVLSVSLAIFYYSVEYMERDPGFARYFAYLSLFVFSMTGIVLSNNFLQLFIFWELVGMSSYLLIGFWYEKNSAADAGKKAFLTNRLGDYGFILGILLLWAFTAAHGGGTLNFAALQNTLPSLAARATPHFFTLITLLIFCGVIGKSAQFPLHVWLPDAMEGPTPVSALIHAATMVAAGVYLLARTFFLFSLSPLAMDFVAYLGGFTVIFAATQALVQTDIKRVLAYSTLSQLGYMVMAIGLGSSGIAMYHLTTHAFFKALLFLTAGSIIHITHEQDMTKMGGLFSKMPLTAIAFIVGALSLSGIYPTSGFFSKDEILLLTHEQNLTLFWVGIATAFLTAIY
ncbi:MAG: NADH-quinone oxidoreductase subunit L, partial [Candidatus Omnitrophica bacterium]|nr:NADH-quinone oxidoreductase subunit L [Candidatus Omnitrophota bacterium]